MTKKRFRTKEEGKVATLVSLVVDASAHVRFQIENSKKSKNCLFTNRFEGFKLQNMPD